MHQPAVGGVQELRKVRRRRATNRNQPTLGDFFAIRYVKPLVHTFVNGGEKRSNKELLLVIDIGIFDKIIGSGFRLK